MDATSTRYFRGNAAAPLDATAPGGTNVTPGMDMQTPLAQQLPVSELEQLSRRAGIDASSLSDNQLAEALLQIR